MSEEKEMRQLVNEGLAGCEPEIGRWLWALQDTRRRTKQLLGDLVEPWMIDWVPHAKANSIGTLLYHIAAIEMNWLYYDVFQQAFPAEVEQLLSDEVRDEEGHLTMLEGLPLAHYLQLLDTMRRYLLDAFRGMTLEEFRRLRQPSSTSHLDYEVTPEWVLHHLMQHEAEHRGQIQMLLEDALQEEDEEPDEHYGQLNEVVGVSG